MYPFIEAKMTKDRLPHNLLQRPRDVPVRTSLGVMALTFYMVLFLSGGNDIIAKAFDISLNAMTIGRAHRAAHPAADRVRVHLPDLPGPAAS